MLARKVAKPDVLTVPLRLTSAFVTPTPTATSATTAGGIDVASNLMLATVLSLADSIVASEAMLIRASVFARATSVKKEKYRSQNPAGRRR